LSWLFSILYKEWLALKTAWWFTYLGKQIKLYKHMTNFQLLALKRWVWIWTNMLFALNLLDTLSFNVLFWYSSRKYMTSSYGISWSQSGKFVEMKEILSFVCVHKWLYIINIQPLKSYTGTMQFKTLQVLLTHGQI